MKEIIKKIFNKEYKKNEKTNEDIVFYEKENKEYFLVAEYLKEEIEKFFESEKTNNLIKFFDERKKEKEDIQKNTSLIIFLKVDNLKQLEGRKMKNQIFKIEEDEYFFRKYVIVYTNDSIKNLGKFDFIEDSISEKIKEPGKFEKFQNEEFFSAEYYFLIQLIVKLPFLRFGISEGDDFVTIESEVKNQMGTKELDVIEEVLSDDHDSLKNILEENDNDSNYFLSENDNTLDGIIDKVKHANT